MGSPPLKVLLVSHEYPPYVFGGVASYVKELAEGLSQHDDIYVTVVTGRTCHRNVLYEKHKDNLTVVRLCFPDKPIRSFWFQYFGKETILKLAKNHDIIHINPPDGSLLLPRLKRLGKRIFSTFHGSMLEQLKLFALSPLEDLIKYSTLQDLILYLIRGRRMASLEQLSYALSDCSIFVAMHVADEFSHYYGSGGGQIKVIYPGIKSVEYSNEFLFSKIRNNFFYSGRLYFLKGPQYCLEAFRKYIEHEKLASELHVYGNGPLIYRLKNAFKRNIARQIKFLGMVERSKYIKKIPFYKAMIFPSLYEGCPISMIEALSLGVPIISFNTPWINEFKDLFSDLIKVVNVYDVEELAKSMANLCEMKNAKPNQNVLLDFAYSKFINGVKTLYSEFVK